MWTPLCILNLTKKEYIEFNSSTISYELKDFIPYYNALISLNIWKIQDDVKVEHIPMGIENTNDTLFQKYKNFKCVKKIKYNPDNY